MTDQHLIVLRGNAASGKTTLARELQLAMGRGTANIGQDHFRRVVPRERDVPNGDNIELIAATAQHCLAAGYHVILEGIFVSEHYGTMLGSLLEAHQGTTHVIYLDVPAGRDASSPPGTSARRRGVHRQVEPVVRRF